MPFAVLLRRAEFCPWETESGFDVDDWIKGQGRFLTASEQQQWSLFQDVFEFGAVIWKQ